MIIWWLLILSMITMSLLNFRCLDLMNKSALHVMRTFYPNIILAYGNEFVVDQRNKENLDSELLLELMITFFYHELILKPTKKSV